MKINLKSEPLIKYFRSETVDSDNFSFDRFRIELEHLDEYDFSEIETLLKIPQISKIYIERQNADSPSYESALDKLTGAKQLSALTFVGSLEDISNSLLSKTSKFENLDTLRFTYISSQLNTIDFPKLERLSISQNIKNLYVRKVDLSNGLDFSEESLDDLKLHIDDIGMQTLPLEDCKKIKNIDIVSPISQNILNLLKEKFSNLENIVFSNDLPLFSIDKIEDFFNIMNKTEKISLGILDVEPEVKEYLQEHTDLKSKYSIFGNHLYNLEKTKKLKLNIHELSAEIIENFKKSNFAGDIEIEIQNVGELPYERILELQKYLPIKNISIYSPDNNKAQNYTYTIGEYTAISEKLQELVEGIDDNLSEKEKFSEIYKRVAQFIAYDTPAAYPKNKKEEIYSSENTNTCRNLKNALLDRKAVCAGYADVLKNACALKGIEALYISGPIDSEIPISHLKKSRYKDVTVLSKNEKTKKATIREYHAWNKVKLDGEWYNFDPTWDRAYFANKELPKYAFRTDESLKNERDSRTNIKGPECISSISKKELKKLFGSKITKKIKKIVSSLGKNFLEILDNSEEGFRSKPKLLPPGHPSPTQKSSEDCIENDSSNKNNDVKTSNPWSLDNYGLTVEDLEEINFNSVSSNPHISKSKDTDEGR